MGTDAIEKVYRYYNEVHVDYTKYVGHTWQAGQICGMHADPYRSTIRWILQECGLSSGAHILDAGAGVCGPSVHICEELEKSSVVAVTIVPAQAVSGRKLVAEKGLTDRIDILVGDYHSLPHENDTFDAALFLESAGHSEDLTRLFAETFRVTKPGGTIYVKDVFCSAGAITAGQQMELDEFNNVWAYSLKSSDEYVKAIAEAGFRVLKIKSLYQVSTRLLRAAMWEADGDRKVLSPFGRRHHRPYEQLPIVFAQILGIKPAA